MYSYFLDVRVNIVVSTYLAFTFLQSIIEAIIPQDSDPPAMGTRINYLKSIHLLL